MRFKLHSPHGIGNHAQTLAWLIPGKSQGFWLTAWVGRPVFSEGSAGQASVVEKIHCVGDCHSAHRRYDPLLVAPASESPYQPEPGHGRT